jgi:hypothetical protein
VSELALLLLLQVGLSRVAVESSTSCPTAAEVETRLAALLPSVSEGAPREHATISTEEGTLSVHLISADGTPIGQRTLTLDVSCADRANVIAVVIAAWEAQQRPELMPAPALASTPSPPAPVPTASVSPPPVYRSPLEVEITVGPALTWSDGTLSAKGIAAATIWGRRLGARAALFGAWPQQDGLGEGQARWTRTGATLELGHRTRGRAGRLDLHGGVAAGAVIARGQGFESDRTTGGFSPGLTAALDWSWSLGRVALGLGAGAWGWTAQRLVSSSTSPATRPLPRLELALNASVGFTF